MRKTGINNPSKVLAGLTASALLGLASFSANAVILYTTANFGTDNLYRIDTAAQTTTFIGDTGVDFNFGLGDRSGSLYGFDTRDKNVKEINPNNGAIVNSYNVGLGSAAIGEGGIAFDSSGLGYLAASYLDGFWSFDINNLSNTSIGSTAQAFDGIDFNSSDVLYGLAQGTGDIYTIDTANAATTLVGSTGIVDSLLGGLTFDTADNLFAIFQDGSLYNIDAFNGTATFLFGTGLSRVSGLSALDMVSVPEPGTLILWGIGLIGIGASRNRPGAKA